MRHVLAHRDVGQVQGPNPEGTQRRARAMSAFAFDLASVLALKEIPGGERERSKATRLSINDYDYVDLSVALSTLRARALSHLC
jgi:hypothetical protein